MADPLPPGLFWTRCPACGAPRIERDPQIGARVVCLCGAACVVVAARDYAVGLELVNEREEG